MGYISVWKKEVGFLASGFDPSQVPSNPKKFLGFFCFPGLLKRIFPYLCNPFWDIILLSSVG
jgi:hypothetical protein